MDISNKTSVYLPTNIVLMMQELRVYYAQSISGIVSMLIVQHYRKLKKKGLIDDLMEIRDED